MALAPTIAATATTSHTKTAATEKCTGAPSTLNIGLDGTPGAAFGSDLPWFAEAAWIQRECHTTLNVEYFSSGSAEQAALVAGSVDYIGGGGSTQLEGIQAGQDQDEALFNEAQGGGSIYVAPNRYKGYGTGEKALAKFANLTWGVPSTNGAGVIFNNAVLKLDGVNPGNVKFVAVGNNAEPALLGGQVQLAVSAPPSLEPAVQTGQYYVVWYSSGLQAYLLEHEVGSSDLVGLRSFDQTHKSLTFYMVLAAARAYQMLDKDLNAPAKIYATYPANAQAAVPYSTFLAAWPFARGTGVVSGLLTRAFYQHLANLDYNYRILPTPLTVPADAVNTSYYNKAEEALGITPPTTEMITALLPYLNSKHMGIGG
jgi:ABC-type nitrate/sulfonate/bicarbonate transport system substrate-binding protein